MRNNGENMQNDRINEERERIEYIKAKTDMSNPVIVLKVYNMLVEKDMFSTSVGIEFLNDLRQHLLKADNVSKEQILPLPEIKADSTESLKNQTELQSAEETAAASDEYRSEYQLQKVRQYKSEAAVAIRKYEMAKIKIRNYRIIVAFMALLVVLVCVLTLVTGNSPFVSAEVKVRNEYSAWKEELEAKEQELSQKEQELMKWEESLKEIKGE